MKVSAPQRYTLRRVLYVLSAAAGVATSGYAAVIAPLDDRLDEVEAAAKLDRVALARLSGQMDVLLAHLKIPYPAPTPHPFTSVQEP